MTQPDRSWVWRSTKQSRDAGQISVLAVAETVFAVAFYWWLALYIDTAALLVISPIVAFMVLLRSPQSIAEGVRLFDVYDNQKSPSRLRLIAALMFATLICGTVLYFSRGFWQYAYEEYALIIFLLVMALFLINVILSVLTTLLGPAVGNSIVDARPLKVEAAVLLSIVVGLFTGLAFRVLAIRAWSTLRFLKFGIRQFLLNWHQLTLKQDLLTPPDLLPGLPDNHDLHFSQAFQGINLRDSGDTLLNLIGLFILYLPAVLYRITLKSTAWLYLPLVWMAHVPATLREAARQEVWIKSSGRNWIGVLSAAAMLAFAIYLAFDREAFTALSSANETQPLTPFHMIWALDPAQWALWFWVTVPLSTLTIALWVLTNRIGGSLKAGGQLDWHSMQLRGVIILNQIKNALAIAWIVITFLSVARLGWLLGKLPEWMRPAFEGFVLPVTNLWAS